MLSVPELIDVCKQKSLNVTYQRLLIYKSVSSRDNHPTAEEIYHDVKSEYPSISLATVYKTLEKLAAHKLIGKVTTLHDLARYDANTKPHHHLVCVECRKVVDIQDESLNELDLPEYDGFDVAGYKIQFEGICIDCKNKLAKIKMRKNRQTKEEGDKLTFCEK